MRIGKYSVELRAQIVNVIQSIRKEFTASELKRPLVWVPVVCSNNTDYESMAFDTGFEPREFAHWAALAEANPDSEYQCFASIETDDYGSEHLRVDLMVRVPVEDHQWLDYLTAEYPPNSMTESPEMQIYRKIGVFLNSQQIADIVKISTKASK